MKEAKFLVFLKVKGEAPEEVGEVTLTAETFETLTEQAAVKEITPEIINDTASGMILWRGTVTPREVFRGFSARLVSRWTLD